MLDPSDTAQPIGLNVLGTGASEHGRELAAEYVLHVFKSLWAQYWGPRTDAVLLAALLTLTHTQAANGDAFTLVEIPELLTNAPFRRMVTEQQGLPQHVRSFWSWFESLSPAEQLQVMGPVRNKLFAFTARTSLRLALGQSIGLDIAAALRERRILLVTLARGVVGPEAAYLLGSLLTSLIYQAALARAAIAPERRPSFWLHLDEFH
ncbi:MAG: hypothetical protein ACRDYA_16185 [Egibacteraceae bacterium]